VAAIAPGDLVQPAGADGRACRIPEHAYTPPPPEARPRGPRPCEPGTAPVHQGRTRSGPRLWLHCTSSSGVAASGPGLGESLSAPVVHQGGR
jgi:hypothetical protein